VFDFLLLIPTPTKVERIESGTRRPFVFDLVLLISTKVAVLARGHARAR
jgi:hypothetical protein